MVDWICLFLLDEFWLEQFEADSNGPKLVPLEKLGIFIGWDIG